MEASALQAPAGISPTRVSIGAPLLRLRSDAQLVALFRAGHDEAFRIIHDRYRQRLFAYTRQMLPHRQDAEDALQDVFVRAYSGLRASDNDLALRAWLYRVAHNRCIDELRRPAPPSPELLELVRAPEQDPIAEADRRESLRRLIADVRRLPDQQRSALLMRELGGMTYAELAEALGVSIPAVKSLLVRARVALAQALEARDTACSEIRNQLSLARDRGVRPGGTAKRHMRDCAGCRNFHRELRVVGRQFAALTPAAGPLGVLAKLLGLGGLGGGASSYAAAGGGAAAAGGAAGTGAAATGLLATGAGHVATLLAAAIVTAGGAVEIQHTIAAAPTHHRHHHLRLVRAPTSRHALKHASKGATGSPGVISFAPAVTATAGAAGSTPARVPAVTAKPASQKSLAVNGGSAAQAALPPKPSSEPSVGGASDTSGYANVPGLPSASSDTSTSGATTSGSDPAACATGASAAGTNAGATNPGTTSAGTSNAGTTGAGTASAGTTGDSSPNESATNTTGTGPTAGTPSPSTCAGTSSDAGGGSTSTTAPNTPSTPVTSPSSAAPVAQAASQTGSGSTGTPTGSGSVPART